MTSAPKDNWVLVYIVWCLAITAVTVSVLVVVALRTDDTTGTPATTGQQPYGGCKEAARYPNTPGWDWCKANGLLD